MFFKRKPPPDRRDPRKAFLAALAAAIDAARSVKVDPRQLADYLDVAAQNLRMSWNDSHAVV